MIPLQSLPGTSWLVDLLHADYWLLLVVNQKLQHPALDSICLILRESLTHAPFYLFLSLFMMMNFGRQGFWWFVTALALVSTSDYLSSHVIKEYFGRPRPCRDVYMSHQIRFLARYCGANGSFISSHASNHFALATFIFLTLRHLGRGWWLVFPWAASVAYAQVYVGVHYPSDVIAGALFGILLGWLGATYFRKRSGPSKLYP
jgi:undecaprenyl-diphosphatase